MKNLGTFLIASILALPAGARTRGIPVVHSAAESAVPRFEQDPSGRDLYSRLVHFWDTITDMETPQNNVPGVDFFLSQLESNVKQGLDAPTAEIALNADTAREGLRLAFNDIAEPKALPRLEKILEDLREAARELAPLLEENKTTVDGMSWLADQGEATASGFVLEPPNSSGSRVPIEVLQSVHELRPRLIKLQRKLDRHAKKIAKVRTAVGKAEKRAKVIRTLADRAGDLDQATIGRLSAGRTRGHRRDYDVDLTSERVIRNSHLRLSGTIEKAEEVLDEAEKQLDPELPGLRRAIDALLLADSKTTLGKEWQRRSGKRINWNHEMRMLDSIKNGYEAAPDYRREWWIGRSQMAIDESDEDARKMREAWRDAERYAQEAKRVYEEAFTTFEELSVKLGDLPGQPRPLYRRKLDIPSVQKTAATMKHRKGKQNKKTKSKKLRMPRSFDMTDSEIIGSYDRRGAR